MASRTPAVAFYALALLALALAGPALAQEIPAACQEAGLNLQSSCSDDIQRGAKFFGVSADPAGARAAASRTSPAQIEAFLRANPVSASCCGAAKKFNAARCNCNAQIRELAKSFVGGDATVYSRLSSALAKGCRFQAIC